MWASVLTMAEKWGVPPWEIVPEKSKLWWFTRWQFFETQRAEAERAKAESKAWQS